MRVNWLFAFIDCRIGTLLLYRTEIFTIQ